MGDQHHIIQKQVFDINFISDQRPHELQNRISNLYRSRLENVIAAVFNRMIPEDTLARFDVLALDLGIVPYDRMEDLLPGKLKEALEKELKDKFSLPSYYPDPINGAHDPSVFKSSHLNLLTYFLVTGTLPWWASGPVMTDPVKVLEFLLQGAPGALRDLVIRVGQFSYVRRRIVYQFPEEAIRSVIGILEPDEAEFIFDYHREIVKTQQETRKVKDETSQVRKAVWVFIFTYLLIERGSHFNQKAFVKSTLGQMAGHYNLYYEDILKLLAAPLNNGSLFNGPPHPLSNIIRELFSEQLPGYPAGNSRESIKDKTASLKEKEAGKKETMIAYYLRSGTLPSWAEHHDPQHLNIVLLELIRDTPKIAGQLILNLENKEKGIQNMIFAFDTGVITAIIKLVEPAHAAFMISYMDRVQAVQNKKPVVNADNRSFTRSVRQFVLTYLLIERGSVFNTRMFLESNIRQMAHRYNLQFNTMLSLLITGISGEDPAAKTPLFRLLTEIEKTHQDRAKEDNNIVHPKKSSISSRFFRNEALPTGSSGRAVSTQGRLNSMQDTGLFDVLRFWILYGHLPWWGKKNGDRSPAAMWEELYATHPDALLKLVKYAGTGHRMKQRIAYQLPLATFLATFAGLPDGKEAVEIYQFTTSLLDRLIHLKIKNKAAQQNILMLAWWDTFIASGYQAFDPAQFISLIIRRLSQWTGLFAENIRRSLLKISRNYRKAHPGKLTPAEAAIMKIINRPLKATNQRDDGTPDIRALILQYLPPEKWNDEEALLRESLRILEYFLTWNKWPDQIRGMASALPDIFLKRLLQLLIREKPAALRSVLQRETFLSAARMRIHDLFSFSTGGDDRDIYHLLQEFRQKDLLHYFADVSGFPAGRGDQRFPDMLDEAVLHPTGDHEKRLLRILLSSPAMASFIAGKYGDETCYRLIENMTDRGKETVSFLYAVQQELLSPAIPGTREKEKVNLLFRRFSLHYLAGERPLKTPSRYFALFFPLLAHEQPAGGTALYRSLLEVTRTLPAPSPALPAGLITRVEEQLEKLIEEHTTRAGFRQALKAIEEPVPGRLNKPPFNLQHKEMLPKITRESLQETYPEKEADQKRAKDLLDIEEETIYIHNAGLVLLHPFLSTYFNRTGLMEKGKFVDEEAAFRGVHLLQFLADGSEQHPEHELVLNKILCGLPVEEPVPIEIIYTEQELDISMELLQVVTGQWEKLKNTSIESFRASFLQRDGALTLAEDNSRKLRVEQRGYDVLLQTLPWSIGMIKTSWMEKILYVEWA